MQSTEHITNRIYWIASLLASGSTFWFITGQSDLANRRKSMRFNQTIITVKRTNCIRKKIDVCMRLLGEESVNAISNANLHASKHFNALCMLIEVPFFIYIFSTRWIINECIDFMRSHYHLHRHQKAHPFHILNVHTCVRCDILFANFFAALVCVFFFFFLFILAKFGGTFIHWHRF